MQMDAGLDTGDMLAQRAIAIRADDTAASLHERLAALGAGLIVEALATPALVATPQAAEGVAYAAKIEKSEAAIDWRQPAVAIERRLRAFDPFPGAETVLGGEPLKIWQVRCVDGAGEPGTVIDLQEGCPVVACGQGALALTVMQRPGSRRLPAAEFLKGRPMPPGTRLGSIAPRGA